MAVPRIAIPNRRYDTPMPEPTTPAAAVPPFVRDLDTLVRARYPLIWLVSWEETRLDGILEQLAQTHAKRLYTWSVVQGLRRIEGARATEPIAGAKEPPQVLAQVGKLGEPALVVLKDFHPYLQDPAVVRALRELSAALKSTYTTVILLSPTLQLPLELEKDVTVLDVPLPAFHDLAQLLSEIVGVVRRQGRAKVELTRDQAEELIKAALGLTLGEAENAFAKAIATDDRLDENDLKLILEEKRQVIRKSGLLEYYPTDAKLTEVGGLENLKEWMRSRSGAFGERARRFGLPEPKGLLLAGVQGCGKTLTAKAVAAEWRLPLLRLDMGRIFSGLIGSSEENLRKAIRVAESIAPVVLWVDEIEKGLSGVESSGASDAGVTARVFGGFLTWMQEKSAPVFVVATANRVQSLPPELLRKGRFDELFFIDLPTEKEREEILAIHLRQRGRDPAPFDVPHLADLAANFSGAEIEQGIIAALYHAFGEGRDLERGHLERAFKETVPLATTMAEEIAELRSWAANRTRPASRRT